MNKERIITIKEKGQALLFVIVAVTIALSVGISVSTRALSSQKRISSSDTAIRVSNASEGGAEMMLGKNYSTLASLTNPSLTNLDCQTYVSPSSFLDNGKCVITYPSSPGDTITTKATVSVKGFSMNASDHYWFDLSPGMVKEIRLVGYGSTSLDVCWENKDTAIYTLSYNSSGGIKKGWFVDNDTNIPSGNISGFTEGIANHGYNACATISSANNKLVTNPYGLRIKALYDATRVHVYPSGGSFPIQGYKIASVGELATGGSKESRIVVVYKSFPYSSSIIDSALYSATGGIN